MAKILLIDDDPLVLESLKLQLEANDHQVTLAEHGGKGIKAFEADGFDAVVTDIHMPEVEGIATVRELRRIAPNAVIIAMTGGSTVVVSTGNTSPDYLEMSRALGATDIIKKPFTGADLSRLLKKHLG